MNATPIKEVYSQSKQPGGSQTLVRGLMIVEAVASGVETLKDIADRAGLARSTTYRLASALVELGYLSVAPRTAGGSGYRLGEKFASLSNQSLASQASARSTTGQNR